MPERRSSSRAYTRHVDPPEIHSALTPAGLIESYGQVFGAIRGRSRWRRYTALTIALLVAVPILAAVTGAVMVLFRAV